MTYDYDCIICGGGLAGSSAGLALARRGHRVLIIDKATFPRPKLCGGLLTWKSSRLLSSHFGLTSKRLIRLGAINHVSDGYVIRSLKKKLAEGTLSSPFHFVDRRVLDNHLLSLAADAGAELVQGEKVRANDPATGIVVTDKASRKGRYVIGADGANSAVRRCIPSVDKDRMKRFMAPTIEISLPRKALNRPLKDPELYIGFMDAGYGWVFPNRDRIIIGICGLNRKKTNFSQHFKDFLDFLKIKKDATPPFHGHPLPYGNYLENPAFETTLLAGDAAGLVEPLFGEGIFFALCSGMYAGEAVAQGIEANMDAAPFYTGRLNRYILPELRGSNRLRWALFSGMKLFGPQSLSWLLNLASTPLGDMVHGKRSYAWLLKKQWDF